jgi:carbonic anhydrase
MKKIALLAVLALSLAFVAQAQTADALWADLMAGNARYVEGHLDYCAINHLRNATAGGQQPPTAILSCADSRVPAELVFDRSVGELFVVRVAGNVDDPFNIASLEYSVSKGWTRLIVVMGHSECGAVSASLPVPVENKPTVSLYQLIRRIRASFTTENPDLRAATIMNINYTAQRLQENTTIGKVPIVKAYYDVATGKVERLP